MKVGNCKKCNRPFPLMPQTQIGLLWECPHCNHPHREDEVFDLILLEEWQIAYILHKNEHLTRGSVCQIAACRGSPGAWTAQECRDFLAGWEACKLAIIENVRTT